MGIILVFIHTKLFGYTHEPGWSSHSQVHVEPETDISVHRHWIFENHRVKQSTFHPKVFTCSNQWMTARAQSKIQNQCNDLIQREKQPTKSPHPPHPIIGCDRPHTVPFFSRKNNFITVSSNQQLAINHSATVCLSTIHKMQSCCCCSW